MASKTEDFHELNVAGLRGLLRDRGLKVSGRRAELIERLEQVRPCAADGRVASSRA
ncbi:unnamed protein product, partial [Hapterophycus canaliculatus]